MKHNYVDLKKISFVFASVLGTTLLLASPEDTYAAAHAGMSAVISGYLRAQHRKRQIKKIQMIKRSMTKRHFVAIRILD